MILSIPSPTCSGGESQGATGSTTVEDLEYYLVDNVMSTEPLRRLDYMLGPIPLFTLFAPSASRKDEGAKYYSTGTK